MEASEITRRIEGVLYRETETGILLVIQESLFEATNLSRVINEIPTGAKIELVIKLQGK